MKDMKFLKAVVHTCATNIHKAYEFKSGTHMYPKVFDIFWC